MNKATDDLLCFAARVPWDDLKANGVLYPSMLFTIDHGSVYLVVNADSVFKAKTKKENR